MVCLVCGAQMRRQRENFRYDACGLSGVTLIGVEVSRCPECGEYEVAIPRIEDLHQAIAHALIRKTSRLTPEEIRYLRKYLGWSGGDFAKHMGTTPETVSRWETGTDPIGPQADRLLRLMVVTKDPVRDYPLDLLTTIARQPTLQPIRLGFEMDKEGWHMKAA